MRPGGYWGPVRFAIGCVCRESGRIGVVGGGGPGLSGCCVTATGHLLGCMARACGTHFVLMFMYVFLDTITSVSMSLSLGCVLSSFVLPLVKRGDPSCARFCHTLTILNYVFLINIVTAFVCAHVVICVNRNMLGHIHSSVFRRVRALPVHCFSRGAGNSVVDLCAGSASALHRVVDRTVPRTLVSFFAVVIAFVSVLLLDPLLALLTVIMVKVLIFIAGGVNKGDKGCFIHRRVSLTSIAKFIRRRVGNRHIMGIFGRRRGSGRRFSRLGRSLFSDTSRTGGCTGVVKPIVKGVKGLRFILATILNNILSITNINNVALNIVTSCLRFAGDFARPFVRITRRFGSVIVTLTKTREVFTLVSRGPRASRNCMALIGTGESTDKGVVRYGRRAKV